MISKNLDLILILVGSGLYAGFGSTSVALAQTQQNVPSPIPSPSRQLIIPEEIPALPPLLVPDPSKEQNSEPSDRFRNDNADDLRVIVRQFQIVGSTVFSADQLDAVTQPFLNRPLTFTELLGVRTAITKLYVDQGYITSGAYIPPEQFIDQGIVKIQILEGQLSDIQVTGNKRLKTHYIRDRIQRGVKSPLNINQLLESLRYLQLDPLLETISAELTASDLPGSNVLLVTITEAESRSLSLDLNNYRSSNIGSFQRQLQAEELNLTGRGDRFRLTYGNTDGSHELDASYRIPVNAKNGSISVDFNQFWSRIISEPFEELNLSGEARSYGLTFRQPIVTQPQNELAVGVALQRIESQTRFDGVPRPLSPGANNQGQTRITQLNVLQEWVTRDSQQIFALRSDFRVGLDLGATRNPEPPDGRFFQWQAQAQWLKQLKPDTRLLVRSNLQLANQTLLPLVQFGLGGGNSVRGYPQDFFLVDNGLNTTVEGQIPIFRTRDRQGILQMTPFVDYGYGWNWANRTIDGANHLLAAGMGLQWQWSDRVSANLTWGIPLISSANRELGLDQSQIFFRIESRLF